MDSMVQDSSYSLSEKSKQPQRAEVERLERERQATEAKERAESEERERHVVVLAAVRERAANGHLEAAAGLLGSMVGKRHEGVDYEQVANDLTQARTAQTEVETRLKGTLEDLRTIVTTVPRLNVFPPLSLLREHRTASLRASQAMAAGVKYMEQVGGPSGEKVRVLYEEIRGVEERLGHGILRLGRMVKVLGIVWVIVLTTGGLIFQQHLAAWERKRQQLVALVAEAKAKAEAEEKALAEAKAKAETMSARMASFQTEAGERLVLGLAVRWVPAGRFSMGSPSSEPDRDSDEVQNEVVLTRGLFLAETECTQGQWESVMGGNPSHFKGSDRPVEQVSWGEAVEYCRKLTAKQRAEGVLPDGWEWRLPTEAEWEYAVRAGTTGLRYGELDAIAWYDGNSGSQTHPVSQKTANAWGLYDMMGNVWEWCADWSGGYPTGSVTDPTGPSSSPDRVGRGGSWHDDARFARSANRSRNDPGGRISNLGFRPALSSVR